MRATTSILAAFLLAAPTAMHAASQNLSTSKQLIKPVPGLPVRLNSLPMGIAASPDGHYLAILNAGYGTYDSQYAQSIALLDTTTGKLTDFPELRTRLRAPQTFYQGIAFSSDGMHLYASLDSLTAPEGGKPNQTGNAIAVYRIEGGALIAERLIPVRLQQLARGKVQNPLGRVLPAGTATPAPAGIAVVTDGRGHEQLLVADEFSDDALLIDSATGGVVHRFDLSSARTVPASFPISVAATRDGRRGFVALWNGSAVTELDLRSGKIADRVPLLPSQTATAPGSHPAALALSPDEKTLYVALANRDMVAAVALQGVRLHVRAMFDTRLPGQDLFGAIPDAVAVSADGARLYVANAGCDAVGVFAVTPDNAGDKQTKPIHALGFIPTEWYPTTLAVTGQKLYVATAKGSGSGANKDAQKVVDAVPQSHRAHAYIGTLLYGSLATIDRGEAENRLVALTREVEASNLTGATQKHISFSGGGHPIKHVIYIIKENRTYDQVFGDLGVGDGDPSLTMYGRDVTPNQHKLALQFGVLDNFYDSGEVSGNGHVWSTAGITSDYTEKTWQQVYRGDERYYDFEGVVEGAYPIQQQIPDVDEPASGYLWGNFARHGKSLYHFGEFISTQFCDESGDAPKKRRPATDGSPEQVGAACGTASHVRVGDKIPENYGGGVSPWPWPIPLILKNVATKPELEGHFDPLYPDFNLSFPDQLRAEEFLTLFRRWRGAREHGSDTMPDFVMLRLPNDHTAGTRAGMPRPRASVADNDLAVGRVVEAVSHSAYWDDTAFLILEDDAQDGADHVDAHRSIALVVSKFSPRGARPVVDNTFYTTVSMVRTMEDLLRVPPMNNNDGAAPLIALFDGPGDQAPFEADYQNRDNGMIYEMNSAQAPGAKQSGRMDFRREDKADPYLLNVILWRDAMGNKPLPFALRRSSGKARRKDDDD
ncbi:MAG TPA: bifunctional YncE family protein/alkaline phosphatase family protein [Steroidobacteraceae bacterium]|jgi:DNA-binding beta-propeller fold protein YncE|nr:bifunctional YncE family protein/alkaline phosphatase family protein [Steroidobacteraceae bacterium]